MLPRRSTGAVGLGVAVVPVALVVDLLVWGGDGASRLGPDVPPAAVVVVTAAAYVVLFARRDHAVLAFAVVWVHAVVLTVLIPEFQPFAGLLVALHQLARVSRTRRALAALSLTVVPLALGVWDTAVLQPAGALGVLVTVLLWCVVVGAVWVAGRFALKTEETALLRQEKLSAEAALALSDQRVGLARDLHDVVASAVTLVVLQAGGARQLPEGDARVGRLLESIEATGVEAMRELRELLRALSPVGGTPGAAGSLSSLPTLLTRVRATGIEVEVTQDVTTALREDVEHVAYRVVQESLTNVVKHAGAGSRCRVLITDRHDRLEVEVTDDGGGRPVAGEHLSSGLGLVGLRGRARALGGEVVVGPTRPNGFRVHAVLPLCPDGAAPQPQNALTA